MGLSGNQSDMYWKNERCQIHKWFSWNATFIKFWAELRLCNNYRPISRKVKNLLRLIFFIAGFFSNNIVEIETKLNVNCRLFMCLMQRLWQNRKKHLLSQALFFNHRVQCLRNVRCACSCVFTVRWMRSCLASHELGITLMHACNIEVLTSCDYV